MKSNPIVHMIQTNYYAFYQEAYAPAFMEIDVLLKTMDKPISPENAAKALHVTAASVEDLMKIENINVIDKPGLIALLRLGESTVCKLYQREIMRGLKPVYSPADIAYIYGLDETHVESVSAGLGQKCWSAGQVPELLEHIPIFIIY